MSDERKKWWRWPLRIGCGCLSIPVLLLALRILATVVAMNRWAGCEIRLPNGSGSVVFLQKLSHPIMAEFDRRVRFDTGVHRGVVAPLPMDTCGAQPINVYWISARGKMGPYLYMRDPIQDYLVDLKRGATRALAKEQGRVFAQDLHGASQYGVDIIVVQEEGKKPEVEAGQGVDEITAAFHTASRRYLGRIESSGWGARFITKARSPEQPVRHRP